MNQELIKKAVLDPIYEAAVGRLFTAFPFLNWWPLNKIIRYFTNTVYEDTYKEIDILITIQKIQIDNEEIETQLDRAGVTLLLASQKFGKDSDEYKKAKEETYAKMAEFVRPYALRNKP